MTDLEPEANEQPVKRTRTLGRYSAKHADYHDADSGISHEHESESAETIEATEEHKVVIRLKADKKVTESVQRPQPAGKPQVWANGRGSLCEALPYFRSFKSSLYSANVVAKGFLIDQAADDRDMFGAQVIIASV